MAEGAVHELQTRVEGVEIVGGGDKVDFMGDHYRIAEKVGLMPLMKFAMTAKQGANADDMEGLSAMYSLIKDCIDPAEWERFEQDAIDKKAEADDLLKVVQDTIQILSARPTRRPADSSAGPQTTSEPSKENSSSPEPARRVPEGMGELVSITDLLQARSTA
ncbi:hypothetical protein C1I95_14750 [Micromonospora craterilacus]|uniref:Uncharacterized protein n=1 Tax=Micromonospora craterilacus TaxID=1655439 RepID=A0A2W2E0R8_9ACTN|nr:hypothetical protein [Micromonospora craterilacus]PZG17806.1 hypothetical protein C1I95_14750 [Micromonospora craterilacus]